MKLWLGLALAVAIGFGLAAGGTARAEEEVLEVTLEDLTLAYQDNKLAGDQQYQGRKVRFTGYIDTIDQRRSGEPYILFWSRGGGDSRAAYCYFSAEDIPELIKLKKGQKQTLTCTVKGSEFGRSVNLEQCALN